MKSISTMLFFCFWRGEKREKEQGRGERGFLVEVFFFFFLARRFPSTKLTELRQATLRKRPSHDRGTTLVCLAGRQAPGTSCPG